MKNVRFCLQVTAVNIISHSDYLGFLSSLSEHFLHQIKIKTVLLFVFYILDILRSVVTSRGKGSISYGPLYIGYFTFSRYISWERFNKFMALSILDILLSVVTSQWKGSISYGPLYVGYFTFSCYISKERFNKLWPSICWIFYFQLLHLEGKVQ